MLIRDILEESVQKFGEVKAVKWLNRKEVLERSYSEILRNVISTRKGLLAEDFAGKHIALIGTSSVEWIESYLGIITGCITAVPLDAALPCEELIDLINRSDSEALFLSPKHRPYLEAFLANCPKLQKVWMLQEEVEDVPSGVYSINELRNTGINASADVSCPSAEDIATIIFTSGTTGKSKGVMLTQNNLASNVEAVKISAEPGTAMLSVLPIHHAFCLVMDWLKGFSQGATICINDSLLHMVRNMSIFKPDIMLMVPMMIETIYKRLAAADPQIPKEVLAEKVFGGKLQTIFTGGAHLDPYYIDRFAEYGVQILEGYGMSECSPVISNNTPENHKPGSIGRPLENMEIRFENGEILVKGTSVMKGYYQMPDETAETLKDGWLHTGDKGYKLVDVLDKKVSMEEFIAQISEEDLIAIFRGEGMCSPKVTAGTAAAFGGVTDGLTALGIPVGCCSDGPSGIRMDCGTKAFSLPNGTSFGCTFNVELVGALYEMTGKELRLNKIDSLLGPGMNIHRNPLNGRNFEYISEDPILTGSSGEGYGEVWNRKYDKAFLW